MVARQPVSPRNSVALSSPSAIFTYFMYILHKIVSCRGAARWTFVPLDTVSVAGCRWQFQICCTNRGVLSIFSQNVEQLPLLGVGFPGAVHTQLARYLTCVRVSWFLREAIKVPQSLNRSVRGRGGGTTNWMNLFLDHRDPHAASVLVEG